MGGRRRQAALSTDGLRGRRRVRRGAVEPRGGRGAPAARSEGEERLRALSGQLSGPGESGGYGAATGRTGLQVEVPGGLRRMESSYFQKLETAHDSLYTDCGPFHIYENATKYCLFLYGTTARVERMNVALAQIALIFLPGLIWSAIDSQFGSCKNRSQFEISVRAFLFGVFSYSMLFALYSLLDIPFDLDMLTTQGESKSLAGLDEIFFSVPLAFVFATIWLYAIKYRWAMKFFQFIGATNRFGDDDVWSFTFNSNQPHVEYVHVRQLETGVTYAGFVNAYSEDSNIRELLLKDAEVYAADGTLVSTPPHVYLSFERSKLWIEFPYKNDGETNGTETENADPI